MAAGPEDSGHHLQTQMEEKKLKQILPPNCALMTSLGQTKMKALANIYSCKSQANEPFSFPWILHTCISHKTRYYTLTAIQQNTGSLNKLHTNSCTLFNKGTLGWMVDGLKKV